MLDFDSTTAVSLAAGSVVIALIICIALRRHKKGDAAIRWLVASNIAFLIAASGVLGSVGLPFFLSAAMVIGGAYAGICFAFFAVLQAEDVEIPLKALTAVGAVSFAFQVFLAVETGSVAILMASSSVINTVLTGYIVAVIWRQTQRYGDRIAALLCLPFVAILTGYALRLPIVVFWPQIDLALGATALIIVAMAWAAVILELAMIALRETQARVRLKSALERAEIAAEARNRFLLGLSHELRTPLNAILGLSELMRQQAMGPLPEAYAQHAEEIHRNGTELSEMISDLLFQTSDGLSGKDEDQTPDRIDRAVREKFAGDILDRDVA
jgi:signal transduction histidine kinase